LIPKRNNIFTLLRALWKEPYITKGSNLQNSLLWTPVRLPRKKVQNASKYLPTNIETLRKTKRIVCLKKSNSSALWRSMASLAGGTA
jgi:hypothetical protein